MRLLEEIMEMRGSQEHWHIYTTGHSMGGALAILFAYELSVRQQHCRRAGAGTGSVCLAGVGQLQRQALPGMHDWCWAACAGTACSELHGLP